MLQVDAAYDCLSTIAANGLLQVDAAFDYSAPNSQLPRRNGRRPTRSASALAQAPAGARIAFSRVQKSSILILRYPCRRDARDPSYRTSLPILQTPKLLDGNESFQEQPRTLRNNQNLSICRCVSLSVGLSVLFISFVACFKMANNRPWGANNESPGWSWWSWYWFL